MPQVAGNWSLIFELRAGSHKPHDKGVHLDQVTMTGQMPAETLTEYFQHTTTTPSLSTSLSTTTMSVSPTVSIDTTKSPVENARIFGTKGAEIFMIILVVIFFICLIALAIKYVQLRDKLKEYRLHGGETGATRYLGGTNPAYDNPMYNTGHRTTERYTQSGSIPYIIGNNNNTRITITQE